MNSGVFPDGVGPYFSPYSVFQLRIPIDFAQQTELEMEWGGGFSQSFCVYL